MAAVACTSSDVNSSSTDVDLDGEAEDRRPPRAPCSTPPGPVGLGQSRQQVELRGRVRVVDGDPTPLDPVGQPTGRRLGQHRPVDAVAGHQLLGLGRERLGLGLEGGGLGLGQQGPDPTQEVRRRALSPLVGGRLPGVARHGRCSTGGG